MSFNVISKPEYTVDKIDFVTRETSCQRIVKKIKAAGIKNRFSYDWEYDNKWQSYYGRVSARWNSKMEKCEIVLQYDDGFFWVGSFNGDDSLSHFARDTKRNFTWLNGAPKWFKEASEHSKEDLLGARDLLALRHHQERTHFVA